MKVNMWEEKLKKVLKDHDGQFGHNVEIPIRRYLHKIEKLSCDNDVILCKIEVVDEYTIKIILPEVANHAIRENVLMHILTKPPLPSECRYDKKKNQLILEWHF